MRRADRPNNWTFFNFKISSVMWVVCFQGVYCGVVVPAYAVLIRLAYLKSMYLLGNESYARDNLYIYTSSYALPLYKRIMSVAVVKN